MYYLNQVFCSSACKHTKECEQSARNAAVIKSEDKSYINRFMKHIKMDDLAHKCQDFKSPIHSK